MPESTSNAPNASRPTTLYQTLVSSGLVDGLALHRVLSEVAATQPSTDEDHDRQLATKLLEIGGLNAWQIDQLRQGRSKFSLGPYRVIDAIAGGGMGHVFKAEHELLGRVEAVKVLPRAKSSPESIASFRHEIRAQAQLDHPNLVRVSYADRDGDTYFFVTEYVPGIDLRRLIRRRGELDEGMAAAVICQAAEAIDYAHRQGLVHRDVKPGNLLITPDGQVKVTDLGLAWYLDNEGAGSTPQGRGKVVGTSDYLAPEAIRHPERIQPVSDLYGLGCTLYYCVTGKVPFPGGKHMQKMRRHLKEEPTDPKRLNPELSDTMLRLVRRLLAKSPEDRPASAAVVAETLRPLIDGGAKGRVASLVRDTVADRRRREAEALTSSDGDASTARQPADDLPETVGLPIDDPSLLASQDSSAGAEPAMQLAPTGAENSHAEIAKWNPKAWLVTVIALGASAVIGLLVLWKQLAG